MASIINTYSFGKKITQDLDVGVCLNIDAVEQQYEPINDLKKYFWNLSSDVEEKNKKFKNP